MGDANLIRTLRDSPNLATRAIGTPLSSPKGTIWYRFDPKPSGWCKTAAHVNPQGLDDTLAIWLERLPAVIPISTWEESYILISCSLSFPRKALKSPQDILMIQQHQEV
ncbi:hypothetical protein Tco_0324423 [Tanacetum coccineum]